MEIIPPTEAQGAVRWAVCVFNPLSEAYHRMTGDWPQPVPKTYYRLKKDDIIDSKVVLFSDEEEGEYPELQALDEEFKKAMEEKPEEEPKELKKAANFHSPASFSKEEFQSTTTAHISDTGDSMMKFAPVSDSFRTLSLSLSPKSSSSSTKEQQTETIKSVPVQKNKWTRPFTLNQVIRAMTAMKVIVEMTH